MTTVKIKLSTIEEVRKFVNIVCSYEGDIDLKSGRYVVDAKSIMGIFSLDLFNPIDMEIHSDDCAKILSMLDEFIVK